MDNDALIEADATVDGQLRFNVDGEHSINPQLGSKAVSAAGGGVPSTEQTPLLSPSHRIPEPTPGRADAVNAEDDNEPGDGLKWPGLQDFDGLPWHKTPSVYWMIAPFLLFTLAYGGTLVPKLNLITDLICAEYISGNADIPTLPGGTDDQCRIPQVQSRVAVFAMIRDLLGGILAAIVAPRLGALSDRYGRTRIIVVTTLGMLVGDVIFLIVATLPDTFSVYWLILGYALDGLSGSFIAGMAIAHAYAADCTPPAQRNVAFGLFHGCLFTGLAFGPLISGLIVKATGHLLVIFYIALVAHLIFIFCLLFVIPESLSQRRQLLAREKHAKHEALATGLDAEWRHRLKRELNIFRPLAILWPKGEGSSSRLRRNLVLLASVDTIMFGVAMGSMTIVVIYTRFQFAWGTPESSYFVSVVNISRVSFLLLVLPLITRLFRGSVSSRVPQAQRGCDSLDLGIIRVAVIFDCLGFLGFTLASSGAMFVAAGVLASLGGIGSPTLQSALTKHVPTDRTGQMLGATGTLHSLARVVAPAVFNSIYALTVGKYTQTVFLCLTICFAFAIVLSFGIKSGVYLEDKDNLAPGVHEGEVEGEVGRS